MLIFLGQLVMVGRKFYNSLKRMEFVLLLLLLFFFFFFFKKMKVLDIKIVGFISSRKISSSLDIKGRKESVKE